jgi:transcriptional/translational regulatory protein YebC/TACO1
VSNFLFDYLGSIRIEKPEDIESFELSILETDAQDYIIGESDITITTDKSHLVAVKKFLQEAHYTILESQLIYQAKNYIEVTEFETALKIYKLLEAFHDDEDVE